MLVFQLFSFIVIQIQKYFDPIMHSSSLPGRAGDSTMAIMLLNA